MTTIDAVANPFSTRFVRPGALPYVFPAGASAEGILARWQAAGCRGAIVGPHGTGKSTLLCQLIPRLEAAERHVRMAAVHDGEVASAGQALAAAVDVLQAAACAGRRSVLIVDGWEQLGWLRRWRLRRRCAASGIGLLATMHRPIDLPVVHCTAGSLAVLRQLVAGLDPSASAADAADVAAAFTQSQGNVREALFALYDRWEKRRRNSSASS